MGGPRHPGERAPRPGRGTAGVGVRRPDRHVRGTRTGRGDSRTALPRRTDDGGVPGRCVRVPPDPALPLAQYGDDVRGPAGTGGRPGGDGPPRTGPAGLGHRPRP
ncbi:hypothetical protein B7C62_13425 [Kitasatospora albolonga]|uniref:Uncharacterized protein n=1 Tax=Kitasatospora albolonga TaxID=68173 RepID=A0ABC8BS28_9ACTN|nr:hypothetical protein B7C62_13425 [Kitasatospora albolonga]